MPLVDKLKKTLDRNLSFLIASGTFTLASTVDFFSTKACLLSREASELNPLIDYCMKEFGVGPGLLGVKIFFCGSVISVAKYLDEMYKKGESGIRPEYILYPGSVFTAGSWIGWTIYKYFCC